MWIIFPLRRCDRSSNSCVVHFQQHVSLFVKFFQKIQKSSFPADECPTDKQERFIRFCQSLVSLVTGHCAELFSVLDFSGRRFWSSLSTQIPHWAKKMRRRELLLVTTYAGKVKLNGISIRYSNLEMTYNKLRDKSRFLLWLVS